MNVVVDASAILAIIFDERGADAVVTRAREALLSAVNLFEVLDKARRMKGLDPQAVLAGLHQMKITFADYSEAQALVAAGLPSHANGRPLSLADRACLSLAIHRHLPILTGDRDWLALDLPITVELFR
jgi:PIN domain nuclease of toxin-antitoxin system